MKSTYSKTNRRYADQWTLDGPSLDCGTPTLKLTTSHYKERKALVATLSYVEIEHADGYSIEKWQSDWPLWRVDAVSIARFSEKALSEFRAQVLQRVENADFTDERVLALLDRIPQAVAA